MKNPLISTLFLVLSLGCSNACAQEKLVTITYQHTSYGGHESEQVLKLRDGRSHFAYRKKDEELQNDEGMTFYHYFAQNDIYTDAGTQQMVYTKLYQRKYLAISSWPLQSFDWKISSESKQLQGYRVQKATAKAYYYDYGPDIKPYRDEVIAWFAPDLPFSAGPEGYYGLPGLILELHYSGAPGRYVVKNIDMAAPNEPISLPTGGFPLPKEQMIFPAKHPINEKELKAFYRRK